MTRSVLKMLVFGVLFALSFHVILYLRREFPLPPWMCGLMLLGPMMLAVLCILAAKRYLAGLDEMHFRVHLLVGAWSFAVFVAIIIGARALQFAGFLSADVWGFSFVGYALVAAISLAKLLGWWRYR